MRSCFDDVEGSRLQINEDRTWGSLLGFPRIPSVRVGARSSEVNSNVFQLVWDAISVSIFARCFRFIHVPSSNFKLCSVVTDSQNRVPTWFPHGSHERNSEETEDAENETRPEKGRDEKN